MRAGLITDDQIGECSVPGVCTASATPAKTRGGRSRLDESLLVRRFSTGLLIVSSRTYLHGLMPKMQDSSLQLPMMIVNSGDDDNHRGWGDHHTRLVSWGELDVVGHGILASPVRCLFIRMN